MYPVGTKVTLACGDSSKVAMPSAAKCTATGDWTDPECVEAKPSPNTFYTGRIEIAGSHRLSDCCYCRFIQAANLSRNRRRTKSTTTPTASWVRTENIRSAPGRICPASPLTAALRSRQSSFVQLSEGHSRTRVATVETNRSAPTTTKQIRSALNQVRAKFGCAYIQCRDIFTDVLSAADGCAPYPESTDVQVKSYSTAIQPSRIYTVGTEVTLECDESSGKFKNPPAPIAKPKCLASGKWEDSSCPPITPGGKPQPIGPVAGTQIGTQLDYQMPQMPYSFN